MIDGYTKSTVLPPVGVGYELTSTNSCPPISYPYHLDPYVFVREYDRGGSVTFGPQYEDWKEKIERHENATSELDGNLIQIDHNPGLVEGTVNCAKARRQVYDKMEGALIPVPPVPSVRDIETLGPDVTADNKAKTAFMKDLVNAQTKWKGLTFLGELRDTLRMIRRPALALHDGIFKWKNTIYKQELVKNGIYKISNKAKQGSKLSSIDYEQMKIFADAVSGSWLEYAFGWQPLVNDIHELMEALAYEVQKAHKAGSYLRAKGTNIETEVDTVEGGGGIFHTEAEQLTAHEEIVVYRGYYEGECTSEVEGNPLYYGFRIEELAPTIWEITPWSFLVDYFVNIGDIVTAASYWRSGLKWSNRTVISKGTVIVKGVQADVDGYALWDAAITDFKPQFTRISNKVVQRRTYSGNFVPDLEVSLPTSPFKFLNLAALSWLRSGTYIPHL